MITQEDLEIIAALLSENGIAVGISPINSCLWVHPESTDGPPRLYLIFNGKPFKGVCDRPNIADPNFVKNVKSLVKICNGYCETCWKALDNIRHPIMNYLERKRDDRS